MDFYKHLYVGEKAAKKRFSIIQAVRHRRFYPGAYVITPASNGNNILDIYSTAVILQKYYQEADLLIVGIAASYWEALEVAGQIVDDMYQKNKNFNLMRFLNDKEARV